MRKVLVSVAVGALAAACSPPAQREPAEPAPPPAVESCNTVAPDAARQIGVEDETATAAAAADLRGGRIAPGVYDLVRAMRIGQATGWQGERAVALEVTESAEGGTVFDWAGAAPGGDVDRWTASFSDAGEHPIMSYTCGRIGDVALEFTAQSNALTLRVPDGANGTLHLEFQRRS